MIDPNIIFAMAAMVGALIYHIVGYLEAKNENPDIKYKPSYFLQTLIAIFLIAGLYQFVEIELNFFTLITALITGLGGNASTSLLIRRKK